MLMTRPPPPTGRPPVYAVAGRAFGRTSLRPVVIGCCIAGAIWSLVWTAGAFQDISGEKQNNELKKLVNFDIVLGSLYAGVAAFELFGLVAACTQRIALVRIFVGLSLLTVFVVSAAELLRTVVHFTFKNAIIDECTTESTGDRVRTSFGFWGGSVRTLNAQDAAQFCRNAYNRSSFSTIAWLIVAALTVLFFASVAYSYYRQLLDPNFFRAARAPSDQVRMNALNQQPYGGGYAPYPGYGNYAPPPGPPPPGAYGGYAPPYEGGQLPVYGSEFPARDMRDEKEGEQEMKKDDPFSDVPRDRLGSGPSEPDLGAGNRV